jgi:methylmalonyl-CoA mutase cobalamin-binding domain/chain
MGLDSDHPLAAGEVGRVGVAICSLADMERLLDGIRLDQITTSMTINSTAAILLSLYVLVGRRQGADTRKLSGTIQNDILKEYIARGTYIYPPRPAMRIITDLFAWAGRELPEWNTISISGYHIREAGLHSDPGSRVHAGQRDRLYRGCGEGRPRCRFLRPAPVVLFSTRTIISWKRSPSIARPGGSMPAS